MIPIKQYIEELPFMADTTNSLMNIREYLSNMGFLEKKQRIIHVAGTNGKGSTVFYLSKVLHALGYRVGSFISPHLIEMNERICINMEPISDEAFATAGARVREISYQMVEQGLQYPTRFEFLFYMAMYIFMESDLDFIILETGLGGRLDITNAIEYPILTILTSISMDHMAYLGNTVEEIAEEKAGIIKVGVDVVYDDTSVQASKVILQRAKRLYAKAYPISDLRERELLWNELDFFHADYQKDNAALCILSLYRLKACGYLDAEEVSYDELTSKAISVFQTHIWQGRMHEVRRDIILDGAHNEAGVRAFTKAMRQLIKKRQKKAKLLLSIVSDKEIHTMLDILREVQGDILKVYISTIRSYRSTKPGEIYREFDDSFKSGSVAFEEFESVEEAFFKASNEKQADEMLFVFGSLYLIGEILSLLKEA